MAHGRIPIFRSHRIMSKLLVYQLEKNRFPYLSQLINHKPNHVSQYSTSQCIKEHSALALWRLSHHLGTLSRCIKKPTKISTDTEVASLRHPSHHPPRHPIFRTITNAPKISTMSSKDPGLGALLHSPPHPVLILRAITNALEIMTTSPKDPGVESLLYPPRRPVLVLTTVINVLKMSKIGS